MNKSVQVISTEGRVFTGELLSYDKSVNIILKDCMEKVYSESTGVKFHKIGIYILRGDNVAIVSEIVQSLEKEINYEEVKGKQIKEFNLR